MAERLRLLADLSRSFNEFVEDERRLLALIAAGIAGATGDACSVRLLSEDGVWLEPVAADHADPDVRDDMRAVMAETASRADSGI